MSEGTIAPLIMRFKQSTSGDVEGNRFRITDAGVPPSYADEYDDISPAVPADPDGFSRVDVGSLQIAAGLDGVYDVHVTAYDERKQESAFLTVPDGNFDFSPPSAPTDGGFE